MAAGQAPRRGRAQSVPRRRRPSLRIHAIDGEASIRLPILCNIRHGTEERMPTYGDASVHCESHPYDSLPSVPIRLLLRSPLPEYRETARIDGKLIPAPPLIRSPGSSSSPERMFLSPAAPPTCSCGHPGESPLYGTVDRRKQNGGLTIQGVLRREIRPLSTFSRPCSFRHGRCRPVYEQPHRIGLYHIAGGRHASGARGQPLFSRLPRWSGVPLSIR